MDILLQYMGHLTAQIHEIWCEFILDFREFEQTLPICYA